MAEYIDRGRFTSSIQATHLTSDMKTAVLALVRSYPPADVAPVVHAYWKRKWANGRSDGWICTNPKCGEVSCCKGNFCPNCGAKMDGGGEE